MACEQRVDEDPISEDLSVGRRWMGGALSTAARRSNMCSTLGQRCDRSLPRPKPMGEDGRVDLGPNDAVRVETSKWGGRPHYQYVMRRLGEDDFGVWLWGDAGNPIRRGDDSFDTREATLTLFPHSGMWSASWWQGNPEVELYVNIGTEPVWNGDVVSMIDLDLDVIRFTDGRAEVLDWDDFMTHQVAFEYPEEIIERTVVAAEEARTMVASYSEPFGDAWRRWLPS